MGLEVRFLFDKTEPIDKIIDLYKSYNFDIRDGLDLIMSGIDYVEILEDRDRLIRLIEKYLKADLSLLDYWDEKTFEVEIDIYALRETLIGLISKIKDNPEFYKHIDYPFDISERYLKHRFLSDIEFMLKILNLNIDNGSTKIKYESS